MDFMREDGKMTKIKYNKNRYNFYSLISSWYFEFGDLNKLHKSEHGLNVNQITRETDQSTIFHKTFYTEMKKNKHFTKIYKRFIKEIIKPRYNEEILYQKWPTIRFHFPNNIAVGEFHKDRDYRDSDWAMKVEEVNYYLPLTDAYDTNTIWTETEEDKGDYQPINTEYGEVVEWNATKLTHGNKKNLTDKTRVSFDFRVIPKSRFVKTEKTTINTNTPFDIGGYYEII